VGATGSNEANNWPQAVEGDFEFALNCTMQKNRGKGRGDRPKLLPQRLYFSNLLDETHTDEWNYYPREWISPYLERKRAVGWQLYGLLKIQKGDKQRMKAQHSRNYRFFDAPVGLFFTVNRVMQQGSLLDYGMFLQNIMIAASAHGLSTCPQAAFMKYHTIIADQLRFETDEMLVVGMSLGFSDPSRIENSLVTERAEVGSFTAFHSD
jgi:nitroreductase